MEKDSRLHANHKANRSCRQSVNPPTGSHDDYAPLGKETVFFSNQAEILICSNLLLLNMLPLIWKDPNFVSPVSFAAITFDPECFQPLSRLQTLIPNPPHSMASLGIASSPKTFLSIGLMLIHAS